MHCARRQRETSGLLYERRNDARMAMPVVQGRVGADAVEIAAPVDVPNPNAFAAAEDDGQWRVIRRAEPLGLGDDGAAAAHSVYLSALPPVRARICKPNRLCTSSTASSAVRLPSS